MSSNFFGASNNAGQGSGTGASAPLFGAPKPADGGAAPAVGGLFGAKPAASGTGGAPAICNFVVSISHMRHSSTSDVAVAIRRIW